MLQMNLRSTEQCSRHHVLQRSKPLLSSFYLYIYLFIVFLAKYKRCIWINFFFAEYSNHINVLNCFFYYFLILIRSFFQPKKCQYSLKKKNFTFLGVYSPITFCPKTYSHSRTNRKYIIKGNNNQILQS